MDFYKSVTFGRLSKHLKREVRGNVSVSKSITLFWCRASKPMYIVHCSARCVIWEKAPDLLLDRRVPVLSKGRIMPLCVLIKESKFFTERRSLGAGSRSEIHQEKKVIFEFTSKTLTLEKRIQLFYIYHTNQTLKTLITSNISNI